MTTRKKKVKEHDPENKECPRFPPPECYGNVWCVCLGAGCETRPCTCPDANVPKGEARREVWQVDESYKECICPQTNGNHDTYCPSYKEPTNKEVRCCEKCGYFFDANGQTSKCDNPNCECHLPDKAEPPITSNAWESEARKAILRDIINPHTGVVQLSEVWPIITSLLSEREAKAYWRGSERQREIQLALSEMRIKKAEKRVWDKANNACLEAVAQAISSFKKEIVEKVGDIKEIHINCTPTSLWDNGYKDALENVIKLLNEPQ